MHTKSYSLTGLERTLNTAVRRLFFYRMIWISAFITGMVVLLVLSWANWPPADRLRNSTGLLTCGSVVLAILYAILNHEVSHFRRKGDQLAARKKLAFDVVAEWHKEGMVTYLRITQKLYEKHKHLIEENRSTEFSQLLEQDEGARAAFVSLFNYFECISLCVMQQIHDEEFMCRSFRSVFIAYLNDYDFYIQYRRKKLNNDRIWKEFTDLAVKWKNTL